MGTYKEIMRRHGTSFHSDRISEREYREDERIQTRKEILGHPAIVCFKVIRRGAVAKYVYKKSASDPGRNQPDTLDMSNL